MKKLSIKSSKVRWLFLLVAMSICVPLAIQHNPAETQIRQERSELLHPKDRLQLDRCVDNMIAGKKMVRVKIRGHKFDCDYAGSLLAQDPSGVPLGYHQLQSIFDARLARSAKKGRRSDRLIVIRFGRERNIPKISIRDASAPKRARGLAVKLPTKKLDSDQWYADRAIEDQSAFRSTDWQGTVNLIAATVALRLNQSFRYAANAKYDARPHIWGRKSDGTLVGTAGQPSPILWNVALTGKKIAHKVGLEIGVGLEIEEVGPGTEVSHIDCQRACKSARCKAWSFKPAYISGTGDEIKAQCSFFDQVDELTPGNRVISALNYGAFALEDTGRPIDQCAKRFQKRKDGSSYIFDPCGMPDKTNSIAPGTSVGEPNTSSTGNRQ